MFCLCDSKNLNSYNIVYLIADPYKGKEHTNESK
jgi:hypothetical protein